MRGFISFILVFLSIAIILVLLSVNAQTNYSKAITLKRMHSLELDIKNTALDLAKIGADRAIKEYVREKEAEVIATGKPPKTDINEAKARARIEAHNEMKKLAALNDDKFDFKIWCGFVSETEMKDLRDKMLEDRGIVTCTNCFEIEDEICKEFIQVDARIDAENIEGSAVIGLWKENGVIGISIYSKEMASVSYIPVSEVK